jgi:hypothetical protein
VRPATATATADAPAAPRGAREAGEPADPQDRAVPHEPPVPRKKDRKAEDDEDLLP